MSRFRASLFLIGVGLHLQAAYSSNELSIERVDTGVSISWIGNEQLYRSTEVGFQESVLVAAQSPYFEKLEQTAFFRLSDNVPNILLLIVDDWGIDSIPLYNQDASASLPPMPNLDQLAASGILFENAYAQPTCSPTRATMITGRFAFRHGVGAPVSQNESLSESETTLPEVFALANSPYSVAAFGKWHQTQGQAGTIDDTPNTIGGWPHYSGSIGGGVGNYQSWRKVVNGSATTGVQTYATTETVNDASNWIDANQGNPWFAWVAFNAAHAPFHNPPDSLHGYEGIPDEPMGAQRRRAYEASLEALDTEIGRLLESVDLSETYVILLGDNGTPNAVVQPPFTNSRAKGSLYEGGTHVPMILAGPSITQPGMEESLVHCVDIFATVLGMAGIQYEDHLPAETVIDSVSLLDVLGNASPIREYVLCESFGSNAGRIGKAIREGPYKLVRLDDSADEFYDVASDPSEQVNLLSGSLNADQQAAYEKLSGFLGGL